MSRKNITIIIFIVIGIGLISLVIYSLIPKTQLRLSVAPDEFTVSINGVVKNAKTGDVVSVKPGEVEITLSRNEFDTYSEKFTIKDGETREVLVALNAQTDAARELLNSEKSQIIIQRIGGSKVEQGAKNLVKENPILGELPIQDRFYSINVCNSEKFPDDKKKFAICVRLFDLEAKQSAIDDLSARGYKLEDYEFIFVDLTYGTTQEQSGE